ncbi:MAG: thiamine phosphate synthase [Micromonosporaceae bacterium]
MTGLPELLLLTDRHQARLPLVETVARAVEGGARAIVLREKDLPGTERAALAEQLWRLLEPVGGMLIAASWPVGPATGVHLAAADPLPPSALFDTVGRSCHDASEVDAASVEGLDYLTVSPVYATASKPGYGPPLGVEGLRALCRRTPVPAYALGGVTPATAAQCRAAGAAGIAVMGDAMRADDPCAAVSSLLDALRSWKRSVDNERAVSKISTDPGGAA